ncbi:MAG: LL-diaminopimelate aminotransferase, partial [Muribaculaceae bacterium]|nr:LL-diaminopimelate aminotransferase [Muribaculaceae bacterium]
MVLINANFGRLTPSSRFSEVARKIAAFKAQNPGVEVIKLSIGDVTRPICPAAVEALHKAADEISTPEGFHGYGPEQGYAFLTEKIAAHDYNGLNISPDEIFISDGAKSDLGNFGDILSAENRVAVTDPVYPVYVDTNVMAGRHIEYLPCTEANGFNPQLPAVSPDIIYLCYPNNPTGTTLTRSRLKEWVDYALANDTLILYDSAYEIFITEPDVPHSIYEIPGAERCAVEFRSFSKTAGFTGLRCGYTVVPKGICGTDANGKKYSLHSLWLRRQTTKFNGASYPIQRAAEAIYSPEGQRQIRENIAYYLNNARLMREGLSALGLKVFGGVSAPYVWVKTPEGISSWEFFDLMLHRCGV